MIVGGRIAEVGRVDAPPGAETLGAEGKLVIPGLIDVHVHLREPGFECKETIESGTRAAVAGGFAAVCAMPNTRPVIDRPERVADLLARAEHAACRVFPIGAATVGHQNRELTDFAALRDAGCVAVTDDAFPLQRSEDMTAALVRAGEADLPFIAHCEVEGLSAGGAADRSATALGATESVQQTLAEAAAIRLWALAYERAAELAPRPPRLHLAHLSSGLGVTAIHAFRERGARVSAETAPHYFSLSSAAIGEFGANAKMNPPLKSASDVTAVRSALAEGSIDVIATDHAPHTPEEKDAPIEEAPFGIVGLETSLAVSLTELVCGGVLSLPELVAMMTCRPARLFDLPGGTLAVGEPADVAVVDPDATWTVEPSRFQSKGRNCPFAGRKVQGKACATFVGGNLRMRDGVLP